MKLWISILIVVCFAIVCSQWCISQTVSLTILHTNDHHGNFFAKDIPGQTNVGGMPARMTLVKEVRQEVAQQNGHLLILDCGDMNTGEPASDLIMAEADVDMMNRLGYEAMAAGNHEFDLTLEKLEKQRGWAKFPYLCANVFLQSTNTPLLSSHRIFEYNGLKVAVFGIVSPHTPALSTNGNDPRLRFEDPEKILPELLPKLRSEADFIIGLMHLDQAEAVRLAAMFPEIDLVISGHSHFPMAQPHIAGKTPVVQAAYYGLAVGRFDLQFQDRKLKEWKYQPIGVNITQPILDDDGNVGCPVYNRTFEQDPEMSKLVEEYKAKTALTREVIGEAAEDIPMKPSVKLCSAPMGNFVADAIREQTKCDIVFQNVGGVRADLLKGKVTRADILRVLPFANNVIVYKLNGEQVRQILNQMIANRDRAKGMLEASGIVVKLVGAKIQDVQVAGQPLDPAATYLVGINSFMAKGGDGYELFIPWANLSSDTGKSISEIVIQHIREHSPVKPNTEFRIDWKE